MNPSKSSADVISRISIDVEDKTEDIVKLKDYYIKGFENSLNLFRKFYHGHLYENDPEVFIHAISHKDELKHRQMKIIIKSYKYNDISFPVHIYKNCIFNRTVIEIDFSFKCLYCTLSLFEFGTVNNPISGKGHDICVKQITLLQVIKPITSTSTKLSESKDNLRKCFVNSVTQLGCLYYCYLCNESFSDQSVAISHTNQFKHCFEKIQKLQNFPDYNFNFSACLDFCEKCVCNNIVSWLSSYKCLKCNCEIYGETAVLCHINSKKHRKKKNPVLPVNIFFQANPVTMSVENNSINFFKNGLTIHEGSYYCHLCRTTFINSQLANSHINNSAHQLLGSNFDDLNKCVNLQQEDYDKFICHSIVMTSSKKIKCLICSCFISSLKCINEHISGFNHKIEFSKWSAGNNEALMQLNSEQKQCSKQFFSTCFKNLIVSHVHSYYCWLCQEVLNDPSAVISHIENSKHQSMKHKNFPDDNLNVISSSEICETCVRNNIVLSPPNYNCMKCHCTLYGEAAILGHINGKRHKKNCHPVEFKETIFQGDKNQKQSGKNLETKKSLVNYCKNGVTIIKNLYYCNLCHEMFDDCQLIDLHIESPLHQKLVSNFEHLKDDSNLQQDCYEKCVNNSIVIMSAKKIKCLICSCVISSLKNIDDHIAGTLHKKGCSSLDNDCLLRNFLTCFKNSIVFCNDLYYCHLCDEILECPVDDHVENPDHQSLKHSFCVSVDEGSWIYDKVPRHCEPWCTESIVMISQNELRCLACHTDVRTFNSASEHLGTKEHRNNVKNLFTNGQLAKVRNLKCKQKQESNQKSNEKLIGNELGQSGSRDLEFAVLFNNSIAFYDGSYFCHLCSSHFDDILSAMKHTTDPKHEMLYDPKDKADLERSTQDFQGIVLNGIVGISGNVYECLVCGCSLMGINCVNQHIRGKKHMIAAESALSNKKLLEKFSNGLSICFDHFITIRDHLYFCNVCDKRLRSSQDVIDHTQGSNHLFLKTQLTDRDLDVALTDDLHQLCVFQSVFPIRKGKGTKYRCFTCDIYLGTFKDVRPHVLGKPHKKKFSRKKYPGESLVKLGDDRIGDLSGNTVDSVENRKNSFDDVSIEVSENDVRDKTEDSLDSGYQDKPNRLARDSVEDGNTNGLNKTGTNLGKSASGERKPIGESKFTICFDNFITIQKNFYFCNLCQKGFGNFQNVIDHTQESNHLSLKKQRTNQHVDDPYLEISLPDLHQLCAFQSIFPVTKKKTTKYRCFVCDTLFSSANIEPHVFGKRHMKETRAKKHPKENLSEHLSGKMIGSSTSSKNFTDVSRKKVDDKPDKREELLDTEHEQNINPLMNAKHQQNINPLMNDKHQQNIDPLMNAAINKEDPSSSISSSNREQPKPTKSSSESKNSGRQQNGNRFRQKTCMGMFVFCNICGEKFMSFGQLHEHATVHFRQYFGPENPPAKSDDHNVPTANGFAKNSNEELNNVEVTGYLNQPEPIGWTFVPNKQRAKKPVPLEKPTKSISGNIQFSDLDVEPDKPKKFDIYKMDEQQLKMIKFSINRCVEVNKDEVYCLVCRQTIQNLPIKMLEHFRDIEHDKNLWQMILDDFRFQTFPKVRLFSDLQLARESMEDISAEKVHCYACDKDVKNDIQSLKKHLSIQQHFVKREQKTVDTDELLATLGRNWYNVQGYWCVFCDTRFSQENHFIEHFTKKKHWKICAKFIKHDDLIFDYCPSCITLIYGTRNSFAYHSQSKYHKYYRDKPFFMVKNLSPIAEQMLDDPDGTAEKIVEFLEANAERRMKDVDIIKNDLETVIRVFVEAKAWPFGSRISGLGSDTSDLDIFLDCNNRYYSGLTFDNVLHDLRKVENALKLCNNIWTINRTIINCRVPIIKVNHVPTAVECDISFTNGLKYETTHLLKTIFQKLPISRKLILFIKQWIRNESICDDECISSYAISWMAIYYLQTEFILPTIITLIEQNGESKNIGGWEAGVNLDFHVPKIDYNFKMILRGFFKMYAEFDYRNNVVCPLLGEPIKKEKFLYPAKSLPIDMEPYKRHIMRSRLEPLGIDCPMVVQDPLDLSNNVTKAVDKVILNKFKKLCLFSAKKLADDYKLYL